jgi:Tol biopolymer transport system component
MGARARRRVCGAALAASLVGALALPALAAKDDLDLVSRTTAGAPADGDSSGPAISADGRLVAFASTADNLSGEDDNAFFNVFARDLQAGITTLVSRATGPAGAAGDDFSDLVAISADGRRVAFRSRADNLSGDDDNAVDNVFVRDLQANTTTLVSRATGPAGAGGNGDSSEPELSADGRFVAFASTADNLSAEDDNAVTNVFVRDLQANTTTLVSRTDGPAGAGGDGNSVDPAISADGRQVAFTTLADNLSAEDDNAFSSVLVRDLQAGTTTLASRATGPAGAAADDFAGGTTISADGRLVAFSSEADNLSAEDDNGPDNVFVRDLQANTTTLVSRATGPAGAGGDAGSFGQAISAGGRHVAFSSGADNLSGEDDNAVSNVFVRDLQGNTTTLVSRAGGPGGAGGQANSFGATVSAEGRFVAFSSEADNLSGEDDNAVGNVFRRDVLGPPPPPGPAPGGSGRVVACAGQRATVVGTSRRDVLRGTARRDVIAALGGNDVVRGRGGNDLICLGAGADRGIGGAGADRILGQRGADRLEGGTGRDLLVGGVGRDLLLGGPGVDRLLGLAGRDIARGGPGADVCQAEARVGC